MSTCRPFLSYVKPGLRVLVVVSISFILFVFAIQNKKVHSFPSETNPPEMRVKISLLEEHLELSYSSDYRLVNRATGAELPLPPGRYKLVSSASGIQVLNALGESQGIFQGPLYLESLAPQPADLFFELHNSCYGKQYRGALEVIRDNDGLLAVNILDLESYLRGVVPREMPPSWGNYGGMEALKAQAVAARAYALYCLGLQSHRHYDLCDTQFTQVYGGKDSETPNTDSAVAQTFGEVLLYDNRVIQPFYHATNGGYTDLAQNVWNNSVPYLDCVADPYDDPANPLNLGSMVIHNYACWEASFPADAFSSLLVEKGYNNPGMVEQVKIASAFESGRVEELRIEGTSGVVSLFKEQARTVLGLRSQLYNVRSEPESRVWVASYRGGVENKESFSELEGKWALGDPPGNKMLFGASFTVLGDRKTARVPFQAFIFEGRGWGHGLGMSQNGAYNRSRAGQSYREILAFYYPGTNLAIGY